MNELMTAAKEAAARDDRFLFIAALIVLGLFAAAVARYFVIQHEKLIQDHKQARDLYQTSLQRMVAEQAAAMEKLIACLNNNSRVMEECRDELRFARLTRGQVCRHPES
jgi:hypothetical protein